MDRFWVETYLRQAEKLLREGVETKAVETLLAAQEALEKAIAAFDMESSNISRLAGKKRGRS